MLKAAQGDKNAQYLVPKTWLPKNAAQGAQPWLPLWLEKLEKLEKLEFGVIFEKGLEKLEKDIIFKAVELEKLDFHIWVRNIFMKCFTCMFIYLWCM